MSGYKPQSSGVKGSREVVIPECRTTQDVRTSGSDALVWTLLEGGPQGVVVSQWVTDPTSLVGPPVVVCTVYNGAVLAARAALPLGALGEVQALAVPVTAAVREA
jgi:hypothetical protein